MDVVFEYMYFQQMCFNLYQYRENGSIYFHGIRLLFCVPYSGERKTNLVCSDWTHACYMYCCYLFPDLRIIIEYKIIKINWMHVKLDFCWIFKKFVFIPFTAYRKTCKYPVPLNSACWCNRKMVMLLFHGYF